MPRKKQETTEKNIEKTEEKGLNEGEKFKIRSKLRVNNALKAINSIETLIDSPQYSMTKEEVLAIQNALFIQTNRLLVAFGNRKDVKKREKIEFNWTN